MPTSEKVRRALLASLPDLEEGTVIDLGSGWGNLIFPLAHKYQNCRIIGYENSPIPYWFSALVNPKTNVTIRKDDFFERSLQDADLILCYLFPRGMQNLKTKFEKELQKGTKVISHTFAIPGWTPTKIIEVNDLHCSKIYFYEV